MPRYLIERRFTGAEKLPAETPSGDHRRLLNENNRLEGVTWLHSYVSVEKRCWFSLYDGPSPEALRRASFRNGLPTHEIFAVLVVSPYAFPWK
jgi:hypothetical protein